MSQIEPQEFCDYLLYTGEGLKPSEESINKVDKYGHQVPQLPVVNHQENNSEDDCYGSDRSDTATIFSHEHNQEPGNDSVSDLEDWDDSVVEVDKIVAVIGNYSSAKLVSVKQ